LEVWRLIIFTVAVVISDR